MSTTKQIPIASIQIDPEYYPRLSGVDWQTVVKYADAWKLGAKFPPIAVVCSGKDEYTLIDGATRMQAAKRAGRDKIEADILNIPRSEWLAEATRRNCVHGRSLSYHDRLAIADRLKREGYDPAKIAKIVCITTDRLAAALAQRIVEGKNGVITTLKAAVAHTGGTVNESRAVQNQGAIANATARRTIAEMQGLLACHAFDLDQPGIVEGLRAIRDALIAMKLE